MSVDWTQVADTIRRFADLNIGWRDGQNDSLHWVAQQIQLHPGLLIADEAGLGKTRIAVAVAEAVKTAGGRVAMVVPPRLFYQWESEYREFRRHLYRDQKERPLSEAPLRHLRSFMSLFPEREDDHWETDAEYPLCVHQPYLIISHGFGLSERFGDKSQPYAWGLPLMVRSFIDHGIGNRRGCRGLGSDKRVARQEKAARWIAENHEATFRKSFEKSSFHAGTNAGAQFAKREDDAEERLAVFRDIVGRLIGRLDLIIIDEAHKSREELVFAENGTDIVGQPSKRLGLLLETILRETDGARRLALTATPIQMSTSDWRSTMGRLKIRGTSLDTRIQSIERFDDVRQKLSAGLENEADVEQLCAASKEFKLALGDVMVRRRWADQTIISRARERIGDCEGPHPHRRWHTEDVVWSKLSNEAKLGFLAAEGRAVAALGTNLSLIEKTILGLNENSKIRL